MKIGSFIILICATNADRSEIFSDVFIAPVHITDIRKAQEFGQEAAEARFENMAGAVIEKVVVKKISEAQL